jgi:hypothetical protein
MTYRQEKETILKLKFTIFEVIVLLFFRRFRNYTLKFLNKMNKYNMCSHNLIQKTMLFAPQ